MKNWQIQKGQRAGWTREKSQNMLKLGSQDLMCWAAGTGNLSEALYRTDTSTSDFQENNY